MKSIQVHGIEELASKFIFYKKSFKINLILLFQSIDNWMFPSHRYAFHFEKLQGFIRGLTNKRQRISLLPTSPGPYNLSEALSFAPKGKSEDTERDRRSVGLHKARVLIPQRGQAVRRKWI